MLLLLTRHFKCAFKKIHRENKLKCTFEKRLEKNKSVRPWGIQCNINFVKEKKKA